MLETEGGVVIRLGALLLVAVACIGSSSCSDTAEQPRGGLQILITHNPWSGESTSVEAPTSTLITDADIVEFEWETQTVVLSDEAHDRVWEQMRAGSLPPGFFELSFDGMELASGNASSTGIATAFDGPNVYLDFEGTLSFTSGYWPESDALLSFGIPAETVEAIRTHFEASGRLR